MEGEIRILHLSLQPLQRIGNNLRMVEGQPVIFQNSVFRNCFVFCFYNLFFYHGTQHHVLMA